MRCRLGLAARSELLNSSILNIFWTMAVDLDTGRRFPDTHIMDRVCHILINCMGHLVQVIVASEQAGRTL